MATIRLTAALDALGGAQPGYDFETEDRTLKTVYPYVAEGKLVWDIPDTPRNRSQIRAEFDSKKFNFELVHIEDIIPFQSAATASVPSDLPSIDDNEEGSGDGEDLESGDELVGETGDPASDPSDASTEDGSKKGQGKKGQGKKG